MTRQLGNITVTKENLHSFPATDEIYGHLTIATGAELRAPRLAMIRGWLTIEPGASLTAPVLGLIDGWLTLHGHLSAIHLTEVRQDFTLSADAVAEIVALKLVGQFNIQRTVTGTFVSLTEIRDSLTLAPGAEIGMPLLTTVGRSLTLRENASLTAPALNHIGGYADIDESARLDAPKFRA